MSKIFTLAEHAMNSWPISSAKNIPPFHPNLPVSFVYLINSHISLKTQFKYHFLAANFPGDPGRMSELLFPGYALQVCAHSSTSSSCFILGSCLHVCLSL